MSIEEALEHDLVASLLEDAVDNCQLVPGAKGWRQHQTELVEGYLGRPDESGTTPLARIHASRREAWLELPGRDAERDLLERALATIPPSRVESEEAIEPLLWLLEVLADGVKLTQTGALPRTVVRTASRTLPRLVEHLRRTALPRSRALPALRPPRPRRRAQTRPPAARHPTSDAKRTSAPHRPAVATQRSRRIPRPRTPGRARRPARPAHHQRPTRRDRVVAPRTAHAIPRHHHQESHPDRRDSWQPHPRRRHPQRPRSRPQKYPQLTPTPPFGKANRIKKPLRPLR